MYVVNAGLTEVPFTPDGMNRSANQDFTTTFLQLTGFTADPAYSGSVVTANALIPQESSTGRTVSASITVAPTGAANIQVTLELRQNGVVLVTSAPQSSPAFGSAVINVTTPATASITALDAITIWAKTAGNSGRASTGYVRIT